MDIKAIMDTLGADETFECTGCTDEGKELIAALRHGSDDCDADDMPVDAGAAEPVSATFCYRSYQDFTGEEVQRFPHGSLA